MNPSHFGETEFLENATLDVKYYNEPGVLYLSQCKHHRFIYVIRSDSDSFLPHLKKLSQPHLQLQTGSTWCSSPLVHFQIKFNLSNLTSEMWLNLWDKSWCSSFWWAGDDRWRVLHMLRHRAGLFLDADVTALTTLVIMGTMGGGGGRTGSERGVYTSRLCQAETFDSSPVNLYAALALSADLWMSGEKKLPQFSLLGSGDDDVTMSTWRQSFTLIVSVWFCLVFKADRWSCTFSW